MAGKKMFDAWVKEYPYATKESARKVWGLYNPEMSPEKADESFAELGFRAKTKPGAEEASGTSASAGGVARAATPAAPAAPTAR